MVGSPCYECIHSEFDGDEDSEGFHCSHPKIICKFETAKKKCKYFEKIDREKEYQAQCEYECRVWEYQCQEEQKAKNEFTEYMKSVDGSNFVYFERNVLVSYLTNEYESWIGIDTSQSEEWQHVVYVKTPNGQLSWHVHKDEMFLFKHLHICPNLVWDGHSTEEKYKRLYKEILENRL